MSRKVSEIVSSRIGNAITNVNTWGGIITNPKSYGATGDGVTNDYSYLSSMLSGIGSTDANILFPDGSYRVGTNITIPSNVALQFNKGAELLLDTGVNVLAAPLTHTGEVFGFSFRNSGLSGNDVYNPIFPSVTHYDALQGVTHIANGSTIEHAVGLSGYAFNESNGTNGVGLYGCGLVNINSGRVWGINTLVQDSDERLLGTGTGRILANEFDFNVMNPGTQVIGLSLGGNSLAQSTNAIGFIANSMGTGIKWGAGFVAMDEACDIAFQAGTSSNTGVSQPSQKVRFVSTNLLGNRVVNDMYTSYDGWLYIEAPVLKLSFGSIQLDAGYAVSIGGNNIISNRQAAVANATDAASVITQLNALLARLRTHGLIAT